MENNKNSAFDIVMKQRKDLVTLLVKNLEKGYIFSPSSWNKNAFKPVNPVSNISYKAGNRFKLMIMAQMNDYIDNRWVTFKQAQEKGWKVNKGELGVRLEKWIFTEERIKLDVNNKPIKDELDNNQKETIRLDKPKVNYFVVFNASQITGMPENSFKELQPDEPLKLADTLIKSSECSIIETAEGSAYYSSLKDQITMPLRGAFKSTESFLHVLLHEMSHSTGHESRLNRDLKNKFGTPDYAIEELNAEIASFFTRSDLGIDVSKDNELMQDHTNYIKSWISVLRDDPNSLFRSCQEADKISNYIINNYDQYIIKEQLKEQEKAIKADLKNNKFKSTKKVVESILSINILTGKNHTLKDIQKAYREKTYSQNNEVNNLIESTAKFLQSQELEKIQVLEQ